MTDINAFLISAISGIIVGLITLFLSPRIDYKYKIKYLKEEMSFNSKIKELKNIINALDEQIEKYQNIRDKMLKENYDREEILKEIDKAYKTKIPTSGYFIFGKFDKGVLDSLINLNIQNTKLGIMLKIILDNKVKNREMEIFVAISEFKNAKIRLVNTIKNQLNL